MPHWNARLNPALERAHPQDITLGSWRPGHGDIREALFGDALWHHIRSSRGRQPAAAVSSRPPWHAGGGICTGMFPADPERMLELADEDGWAAGAS